MPKRLLLAVTCLFAFVCSAQTVQPLFQPHVTFVDNSGNPCAGCALWSYVAGTTSPQATYTDASGASQNTNPIILDASGGATVWMGTSSYKFVLIDAYGTTLWSVDQVSAPAIGPFLPLSGGIATGTIGAPNFAAANTPFFTTGQMDLNNTFNVGSLNFQTEYQASQPATFATEGSSFGLKVPASSMQYAANTIGAYMNTASTTTNAVAGYFAARATAPSTHPWGINPLFSDGGQANVIGYGDETDCNIANSTTVGACILINGLLGGRVMGVNYPAIEIVSRNGKWSEGLQMVDGTAYSAIEIGANATTASSDSMGVFYRSYSAGDSLQEVENYFGHDNIFHYGAAISAPGFSGTGTSTFVVGATGIVGTGATVTCATSFVCDSVSGTLTLTTGTGSLSAGQMLQVTLPATRIHMVNCTFSPFQTGTFWLSSPTFNSFDLQTGAGLTASTTYQFSYVCAGA